MAGANNRPTFFQNQSFFTGEKAMTGQQDNLCELPVTVNIFTGDTDSDHNEVAESSRPHRGERHRGARGDGRANISMKYGKR